MADTCYIVVYNEKINSIIKESVKPDGNDLIIAADIGAEACELMDIKPDVLIGDFDSYKGDKYKAERIVFPSIKDETDTLLAANYGLERGFKKFFIVGGLGGRFDHSIANLSVIKYLYDKGCKVELIESSHRILYISDGSIQFETEEKEIVSIFPFSETAYGVTLEGFFYPLNKAVLTHSFPIGVSNKPVSKNVKITVEKGDLIIIRYKEV